MIPKELTLNRVKKLLTKHWLKPWSIKATGYNEVDKKFY